MIGEVIGNYRIVSELGRGGMGMVYRAEHVQLGKPAALKVLLPQLSSDPAIVQRFFNEARAASAIDHPGIVEVFDFGTHTNGAAYIVMALLKGESLQRRLDRAGPLPPLEGANIVAQMLGALAAAHARNIVHRDLKPDNIFLVPNELMPGGIQVKLLDFGIAKLADDGSTGFKTQTGVMMGTPAYMSPEQCMGRSDLDHRTDLYSVGCILFHLLTGRPPFVSDQGTGMMIAQHIRDPAPDPRSFDPSLPTPLVAIVMRLLEKEPAVRFQTAQQVRDALAAAGAAAPSRPPQAADQYAATIAPSASGTAAAAAGVAPTTASGSAAQVMPAPTGAPAVRGKRGAVAIGGGIVLAALAGVGVWAAMRSDDPPPAPPATSELAHAGAPAATPPDPNGSADPTAAPAAAAAADPPSASSGGAASSAEPCALGKVRGPDTHGNCCWPEQAWSSAKGRCVGAPRCPDGHTAAGEDCAIATASTERREQRRPPTTTAPAPAGPIVPTASSAASPAPRFSLDAKTYAPGGKIRIAFAGPVRSSSSRRAWITVVEASKPPATYGAWTYVADGATTAELTVPSAAGTYEVRFHTDYPERSHHVRQATRIQVADKPGGPGTPPGEQRFMLATRTARPGEHVELTFPVAMKAAPGERFWVTVVAQGAPDTSYGAYEYVKDGARTLLLRMPAKPGEYEIRLHANYPRLSTNLVHRARIQVED